MARRISAWWRSWEQEDGWWEEMRRESPPNTEPTEGWVILSIMACTFLALFVGALIGGR